MSNLVKNGFFTNPTLTAGSFTYISPGSLADWSVVNGILATATSGFQATTPLPTGITQFYGIQQSVPGTIPGISQDITFPNTGTGTLSFWISKRKLFVNTTQSITVSLGSNSASYNKQDTLWYYQTIPFTITNANDLTKTLSISATATSTADLTVYISGISIAYIADTTPCFREGTLISCQKNGTDVEVPIEKLKEYPYLIKTLKHGFLPIHSIGKSLLQNPGNRDRIKRRLYKLSPLNYPEIYTPLYLTGCHGLLVPSLSEKEKQACMEQYEDKVFVTDGQYRLFACLDERAEPYDQEGEFPIYHIALQSEDTLVNYGIYANGLLVESCSIWSLTEKHKHIELFPMETPI